ncbi:MAG TPA: hemerythrin domain-containing protein [Mycobacteriales bacterium]|jgi:hemerythrin superfamily protein|nr:hemerythrin domain-containing protein [Mycobacteriales bacterium]
MGHDAIEFLLTQHREVEKLIEEIKKSPAENRGALFDELRESLAVHETAEELILRPATRSAGEQGKAVAEARMAEENEAKQALADLEKLDPASDAFMTDFGAFAADVLEHATNEEQQEFPLVRAEKDENALEKMATAMDLVEKVAPTHPHPSAKSTTSNVVLGPFASIMDRARDAISSALAS